MDTKSICPSCQKPLAPDVPMGLCPECLIKAGFPTGGDTETGARPAFIPPTVQEIASLFPQLEVLELIGKGGMGAVYKARQKRLNRFVALKILPPGIGQEPAFAERFTREAQALAQLNHPGIVTLYEFGETEGQFYFLMEFVDGVNLRQLLANSRVSTREALAIVPQICDALQFAHDQGIVHRDIKPENILMDRRGRVKVADFGLAKIIGSEATSPFGVPPSGGSDRLKPELQTLTDAGKVMGTPQYMSPEQIQAPGEVDHRADIYALGVVFYQMLTGELPGKTIAPPSRKVHIDVRLDEIVLRALEKKPELRYQQVSEVKTLVETIVATPPGSSRREEAQTEKQSAAADKSQSLLASSPTSVEPRFSRMAIVGACWLICTILLAPHFPNALTGRNADGAPIGDVNPFLTRVFMLLIWLLGMTAPLGTTMLGWMAVSQIRRSAGKLHGMGLAMFDGLVFPLLALDAVIGVFWMGILRVVFNDHRLIPLICLLALVTMAWVDWLIIRRVWRAVSKGGAGVPPAAPTRGNYPGKMTGIGFGGSVLIGVLLVLLLLGLKVHHQLSTIDQIVASKPGEAGTRELNGPLLRVTVRVLDVPASFEDAQLLRPSGLLDSGEVKILAAPYVVVPSGSEGAIELPPNEGIGAAASPGSPVLSGRTKTLYVKPALEPGTAHVHYTLDGLVRGVGDASHSLARQSIRSDSLQLGELQLTESNGLPHGRRQLVVISTELEVLKADAAGNILTRPSAAGQLRRSRYPSGMQVSTNNLNAYVVHDHVDVQYILFHDGGFKSVDCRGWNNPQLGNWQDDYAITLAEGDRTFGFLRESFNPDQLRVNGQNFDLRQGRVLVLNPDATVRQLPLFPPLAVAQKADELAGFVQSSLAAARKLQFGPVVERVVPMDQNGVADALLELETGKLISAPTKGDAAAGLAYLLKDGVNIGFDAPKQETTLLGGGGTFLVDTALVDWDTMSAAKVEQQVKDAHGLPGLGMTGAGHGLPPMTLLFKTARARVGLLQITGFTENPRGVKIRYKLVHDGSSSLAESPMTTNASAVEQVADQEIARLKLEQAEREVKAAEQKFSVGTITEYELQKIKFSRDLAAAEVKNDSPEVARLKLAMAELDLDIVGKKVALGLAPQAEYDQASFARATALVRYQQAQKSAAPSHR